MHQISTCDLLSLSYMILTLFSTNLSLPTKLSLSLLQYMLVTCFCHSTQSPLHYSHLFRQWNVCHSCTFILTWLAFQPASNQYVASETKFFLSKNVKFASLIIFLNCTSPPQKELWQRCPQMSVHSDPQDLSVSAECLMSQDCEYAPDSHSEWAWPLHPHCSLAIALSDFPKWSAIVGKLPFKQMWIAKEKSGEKQTKKVNH